MLLERAQHKFTRMIYCMKSFDYEERLRMLNPWSLEERRNRADLIEVFKSLRGLSAPSVRDLFTISTNHITRGHILKLTKRRCSLDLRKFFFSERVVGRWNSLDQSTVDSQTVNQFKMNLQRLRNARMCFFMD